MNWRLVVGWMLGAAVLGVVVVWLLMPKIADPFGAVNDALRSGNAPGAYTVSGVPVIVDSLPADSSADPSAGAQPNGTGTGSFMVELPWGSAMLPDEFSPLGGIPAQNDVLSGDIARARGNGKSSRVAVEFAGDGRFAVAPAAAGGSPSPVPALLAVAAIIAGAGAGGALLARGMATGNPPPPRSGGSVAALPAGTEPVARPELSRLRQAAGQKTELARSLAELLPSMPDALAWQAEKALAEVGVRRVVPDGEPFDTALHYAVGTEPAPGTGRENTVARTVRAGYSDQGKILVYPKVVVYTGDAGGEAP